MQTIINNPDTSVILNKPIINSDDLNKLSEVIISILKDKKCVAVPNRILKNVLIKIEKESISFRYKKDKKSKWTIIHALYCSCQ